jgi:hypothetical protein
MKCVPIDSRPPKEALHEDVSTVIVYPARLAPVHVREI